MRTRRTDLNRLADVVRMREGQRMQFDEIGRALGVTRARAQQLYVKAVNQWTPRPGTVGELDARIQTVLKKYFGLTPTATKQDVRAFLPQLRAGVPTATRTNIKGFGRKALAEIEAWLEERA